MEVEVGGVNVGDANAIDQVKDTHTELAIHTSRESSETDEVKTEIIIENANNSGEEIVRDNSKEKLKVEEKDHETDSGLEDQHTENTETADESVSSLSGSLGFSPTGSDNILENSAEVDSESDIYEIEMGNKLEVGENAENVKDGGDFGSGNEADIEDKSVEITQKTLENSACELENKPPRSTPASVDEKLASDTDKTEKDEMVKTDGDIEVVDQKNESADKTEDLSSNDKKKLDIFIQGVIEHIEEIVINEQTDISKHKNENEIEDSEYARTEMSGGNSPLCKTVPEEKPDQGSEFNDSCESAEGSNTADCKLEVPKLKELSASVVEADKEKIQQQMEARENSTKAKNSSTASVQTVEEDPFGVDKIIKEKNKMEDQVAMLQKELSSAKSVLQSTQRHLQEERSKHNQVVMSLNLQLYQRQLELKQQRAKSEAQMSDVMSHLLFLEGRLRREQQKVSKELKNRAEQIENQKREIVKLKDQNEQLMNAIKEIYAKGGMNGYMRENRKKNGENVENGSKNGKEKKSHNGRFGSMREKLMAKNRSSLELNNFNLEKYLIKNDRLCSSHEELHRITDEQRKGMSSPLFYETPKKSQNPKDKSQDSRHAKQSHTGVSECNLFKAELNKSTSESSHLSETTNSSGIYSLSDLDLSGHDSLSSPCEEHDYRNMDDSDRIFSFSSTHINTVIDEEEVIGPVASQGQMMSMGSMPMLANLKDEYGQTTGKNRPHSLSSVDLLSIEQQAKHSPSVNRGSEHLTEQITPPSSPSCTQTKTELTPFQTFKTMFRRKGSKNKGKKRSVSLSQTTNKEYSEALKKHFQKYDMS